VPNWFEEQFSWCPHGLVKAYCHTCPAEEATAERERRRDGREREALEKRAAGLETTIERQSRALDSAYEQIRAMKHELQQARRPKRRLFARGQDGA
jgi:hypothetical protein